MGTSTVRRPPLGIMALPLDVVVPFPTELTVSVHVLEVGTFTVKLYRYFWIFIEACPTSLFEYCHLSVSEQCHFACTGFKTC